jgi:hypothetical protein
MRRLLIIAALFVSVVFIAQGCAVTESENVKTSGIWAHYVIDHHPDERVVAWAVFRVGQAGGTIINLVGDDSIEVNGEPLTEFMDAVTGFHWNRAEIAEDMSGSYDFDFIRADETVTTTVVVPDHPTITSPSPGDSVYPGDNLEVDWVVTTPAHHVNFFVNGPCIQYVDELDVEDDGSFVFSEALQDFDPASPSSCSIDLELRRVANGSAASQFQGGLTEAKRMDSIDLSYEQP